ncbi:MAG: hypothetical protein QRY74_04585 [Chlamydia sp.]
MPKGNSQRKSLFDTVSDIETDRGGRDNESLKEDKKRGIVPQIEGELALQGKKMYEDLTLRIEHAFRYNDIAPSAFRTYFSRPQNFSSEEWEALQQQKRENDQLILQLEKSLRSIVSSPIKETGSKTVLKSIEKSSCKENKKPPLTKKDWMDMR